MSSLRPRMSSALETRPQNVNLQFLRENIQDAQRRNLPQTEYTRAIVLSFCWEHDMIIENKNREDLLELFAKIYGYATEKFSIPDDLGSAIAYERVKKVLKWFMARHDAEDTLLVIVYHGFARGWRDRCIWSSHLTCDSVAIEWSDLRESTLDFAKADLLYIFDCCYTPVSNHGKNYELLAATEVIHSAEEEWRHSPSSFTAKLVKLLTILDGEPATVVQIYALLMREAYLDIKRTFTIAPIHRRNSARRFAVKLQPLHPSSDIPEFRLHEMLASAPRALIQASVQLPIAGVEVVEWKQFLMDSTPRIPSLDVTVEAVYQTDHKTWNIHLLVSVDVWALLWDHQPALRFVEFVMSGNIRNSLSYMHGPFERIQPGFTAGAEAEAGARDDGGGLAVIKEEEDEDGMCNDVKQEEDDSSEMESISDYVSEENSSE